MIRFTKHTSFKLADIDTGHHQVTYKGVKAIKCPFDYVLYQMLIMAQKPDLIIEIGTNKGGSSLYLADLLELNGHGQLHTIDLPANQEDEKLHSHPRIKLFKEGFTGYSINNADGFNNILVIEDGSHMYEDVRDVLKKFAPLVSVGSYLIVEDGIVTELGLEKQYNGGPQKAIREFMKNNTQFTIDRKWCDFFGPNATFNVNGYLKKIS